MCTTRPFPPAVVLAIVGALLPLPRALAAEPDEAALERFSRWAAARVEADPQPGLSIGFVQGDRIWATGFGYAELETDGK